MSNQQPKTNYSAQRLKQLRVRMRELKLDAMLSLDPNNARWLSSWSGVYDSEPAHLLLVTATKAYLHTDSRYSTALKEKNKQGTWIINDESVNHLAFAKKTLDRMRKEEVRLGYESSISLDFYKRLKKEFAKTPVKLVETKELLGGLRSVKDDEEIRLLKAAQKITDTAFADLLTWITPGMSELEVANRLEFTLKERGAEGLAFESIVASGPHSAEPHARPSKRTLREGDFVVLDFGARYRDYCADMSRTLAIGKATDKQHAVYDAVLEAHNRAKAFVRAGVTGKQAHELAQEVLKTHDLDKVFKHSLGHSVGIAIHEQPLLSPLNEVPLVAGNVVTVEPGAYLAGYGGVRIEDCGVVGEKNYKSFARSPHELIEIV